MESVQQIKGKWLGFYAYDSPVMRQLSGHAQTLFSVEITDIQNRRFTGTVQDDVLTGGMKEQGRIEGELDGGVVFFKKFMPLSSSVLPNDNRIKTNRAHPVIHYRGEYFPIEKKMRGEWKIKRRIFFYQRKLYITKKTTGTWEMSIIHPS